MKELRHTEERNARRTENLRESQKQGVFVDEFDCQNPHVSVGPIAADGKPDWREFTLSCPSCRRTIKKMGRYINPPIKICHRKIPFTTKKCNTEMRIK